MPRNQYNATFVIVGWIFEENRNRFTDLPETDRSEAPTLKRREIRQALLTKECPDGDPEASCEVVPENWTGC